MGEHLMGEQRHELIEEISAANEELNKKIQALSLQLSRVLPNSYSYHGALKTQIAERDSNPQTPPRVRIVRQHRGEESSAQPSFSIPPTIVPKDGDQTEEELILSYVENSRTYTDDLAIEIYTKTDIPLAIIIPCLHSYFTELSLFSRTNSNSADKLKDSPPIWFDNL